jgi:PPOX class probable F420-dependent enzyme
MMDEWLVEDDAMDFSADFSAYRTILMETFRQDGSAVNTPVWFVQESHLLYIGTDAESWKVKRLQATPRARIAGADAAENPATAWLDVTAQFLEGAEAARIYDLLNGRYDNYYRQVDAQRGLARRAIIALALPKVAV